MADKLNPTEDLAVIGSITSQNGRSTLALQKDGNLVLLRFGKKVRFETLPDFGAVSRAIMQGDGNFMLYGPGGEDLWSTKTNGHPGAYLIVQDDGNVVIYDPGGNPLWATNTQILCRDVTGFLPSISGFHFSNSSSIAPRINIKVLGEEIPIGDVSNGLCGGMVFAARDYFEAGISIPPDTTAPSSGSLFDHLVRRLFDSFNLFLPSAYPFLSWNTFAPLSPFTPFVPLPPFGPGPATYAGLMNPDLPDHETVASDVGVAPRGRAWIMINDQWPKIKADIDSGRLAPMGLNMIKSPDLHQMGYNHQVLAYGYCLDGTNLEIRIYDPNFKHDDTITLSLSLADPEYPTPVTYSKGGTVWCFFQPVHIFSFPPGGVESQSDWRWCHKCQGLFFSFGQPSVGICPAGGSHEKGVSGNYSVIHSSPFASGQGDWRQCQKCQGLFYSGGQSSIGSCPAGGSHEKADSDNYTLMHIPNP